MNEELPMLKLKKGEDRRIRFGHLWIFSNEVDTKQTPLTAFEPGEEAVVVAADDRPVGVCYVNPQSLISARIMSRNPEHAIDRSLITHRLNVAKSLRDRLYPTAFYRLVYGESDGLPGLVVDRFDDVLVCQITTAGMEARKEEILAALNKVLKPSGILWRNDARVREMEGLDRYVEVAQGEVPDHLVVTEGELRFQVSPQLGQKTGWFYDQRDNRDRFCRYVAGARVLDVFSYVGAWGLRSLAAGAASATLVDVSAQAVAEIEANASANDLADRARVVQAEGFQFLKQELADKQRYDVIVLDPPAFVKRKKDFKEGSLAYRRLNELAMRLLDRDGILVTCSCSYHMPQEELVRGVQQAARHVDRNVEILEFLQQGPDHPVHPAIPETRYLKGIIARVSATQ
jgi:23S rRNA (cytosine1962-C5)-methyltransferase